ncbi:MAG: PQQ-dependent sugar dehydrogenase [Acidimicrobiia bacterium]
MTGSDPWADAAQPRSAAATPPRSGLLSGPNLLYVFVTIIALSSLTGFLILQNPFGGDTTAAAPTTSSSVVGDTTTTAGPAGETSTTGGGDTTSSTAPQEPVGVLDHIGLELLTDGLSQPVGAWSFPGDDRVFVIERGGRVRIVDETGLQATPFLDLTDRVNSGGIENGLLGLAFHPDYPTNGRLFVYYTYAESADDSPDSRIAEFRAANGNASTVDSSTERVILEVEQEGIRHRAGMLQFGPDGNLWIAFGDGGLGDYSAQDLESYQGSILRIDVDTGDPYAIPAGNPYAAGGGLPEIWTYGLRNPWRFFIDAAENLIYIGDVGQAGAEEINVASLSDAGLNWGWPNFEGDDCYLPTDGCDMGGWVAPTASYGHEDGACSVTGGIVYRGAAMPEVVGHYFYADWCSGFIRSFRYVDGDATQEKDWTADIAALGTLQISSFGWDGNNEMLVVDSNGALYRVVRGSG